MLVGSLDDVDDVVKTAPPGIEEYVAPRRCRPDGDYRWSLFIMADPNAGDDVEGLVYAVSHDRKRAAVIGLAPRAEGHYHWRPGPPRGGATAPALPGGIVMG
jgi:hypothetical protein